MKPPLRILDTGLGPARWNVAMTAALAEVHKRAADTTGFPSPLWGGARGGGTPDLDVPQSPPACPSPTYRVRASGATGEGTLQPAFPLELDRRLLCSDTVRLHRYPACVLLGASQDLESAADVAYCCEAGVEIARRVTGGGTVYMSPGMLAWDVLVDRAAFGRDLAAVTEQVCDGVAAGLAWLGMPARFRAPNDIVVGGRKVSGSAGYVAGRVAVLQGTVLISDDVHVMARALRLPEAALRERVTCLEAELGAAPALPAVVECITMALAEALGREPVPAEPSSDEIALCNELLRDEIGTDAYVAGRAAAPA